MEEKIMTREKIMNELVARGYEVQVADIIKNGVEMHGITIGNGNIRPTVYVDNVLSVPESELSRVVDNLIEQYERALEEMPKFQIEDMMNWDYAKERLVLCLQKSSEEEICKRKYLDLEQYIRVDVGGGTFKVKPEHLDKFNVTEDELFEAAKACTEDTIVVEDMAQLLMSMGMNIEDIPNDARMVVMTSKDKNYGASAMCYIDKIAEIANRYGKDLAILPSSIHEIILYPVEEITDFRVLDNMVCDVNETQLEPEEVLGNHAYRFIHDERRIMF